MTARRRILEDHEIWKPVPGYEGLYEVSRSGQVKSLPVVRKHSGYRPRLMPGKILSSTAARYAAVILWDADGNQHTFRIHRLVALAFVPNPNHLPFVCHSDDLKTNNSAGNLYWGTRRDNAKDAMRNGRTRKGKGRHAGN